MFRYLLVFVATLESFAHGANDTANATGAFTAVVEAFTTGIYGCSQDETPWWVMGCAGLCVALGINLLGYRVIRTIGSEIAEVDFQRGFCIEFASTVTVIVCTILEMPVSSTHCQVPCCPPHPG